MTTPLAYPLTWPAGKPRTAAHLRQRATFSTLGGTGNSWQRRLLTVSEASDRLFKEIGAFTTTGHIYRIYPGHVVLSTNQVLNRDGSIRSGMRDPEDPGVAVYFKLDEKPYCLPCDKWDRVADNIAAIAAHLGAMRGMERWGVGTTEQAFTGYLALEARTQPAYWETLGLDMSEFEFISDEDKEAAILLAWRTKAKAAHPDNGGSHDAMVELNHAKDIALATVRAAL